MAYINPLDLQTLLVSHLAGSWTIFLFICMIAIIIMAAKFRMTNIILLMIIAVFALLFSVWITWFYIIVLIIAGFAIYFVIAKIIKN